MSKTVAIVIGASDGSILGVFENRAVAEKSMSFSCHKLEGKELEKAMGEMNVEEHLVRDRIEHL